MTCTSPFTIMNKAGVFTEQKSNLTCLFCLILKNILNAHVKQFFGCGQNNRVYSIIINKSEGKIMYTDIV